MKYFSLWRGWVTSRRGSDAALWQRASVFCLEHGLTLDDLQDIDMSREHTALRHRFMFEAHESGLFSLVEIGRFMGRHHTTVLQGIRKHTAVKETVERAHLSSHGQAYVGLASSP